MPPFPFRLLVALGLAVSAQEPRPRFASAPRLASAPGGGVEWSAAVDCTAPSLLIGAKVLFAFDGDLDDSADAVDSAGVSPADCADGRVPVRRLLVPAHPALLRAELRDGAGAVADSHAALTSGPGSLLAIARYCARPKNGEPEWIEVRNRTAFPIGLARVRLEGRVLAGTLAPEEAWVAAADTAELRLWQPGARGILLSSWPSLRNTGDTLRLSLFGGPVLDSVIYPSTGSGGTSSTSSETSAASPREDCASLGGEESAAAALGYALELLAPRWKRGGEPFTFTVRAPAEGRYALRLYDLDGMEHCALARNAQGAASYSLPHAACAGLPQGTFVLHLQPRAAPGVRTVIRVTE